MNNDIDARTIVEKHLYIRQKKLSGVIRRAQEAMARHILSSMRGGIDDKAALNELYGILDNEELFELMNEDL